MPRKSKGKFKPYKNNTSYADAEVFRNSSAVLDDTDPYESLKYMKDIFKDKLDEDVINMIFSECAYNVDQAFETLMSLCNNEDGQHHFTDDKLSKNEQFVRPVLEENNFNSSACQFINSGNLPKQTKSKLAINFSPPSDLSLELPYENTQNKVLENNFQHTPAEQNKNTNLGYNNSLNRSDYLSFPVKPENYTSYELKNSFGNIFSTSFNPSCSSTSSPVAFADSVSSPCESFTGPQFITPHLPTPVYKYGSFNRTSPNSETSNTFWDLSKKLHLSSAKSQNTQKKQSKLKEAIEKIKSGSHILVILRGLPGSGKSSLARKLKFSGEVFSADDFFVKRGKYIYDPFKVSEAHAWNKHRTKQALERGVTPIIIDNTNVEAWEITPYVLMGKKYNYEILILEPDTPWKFNVHQLSIKNTHGVPKAKIAKMKERYQHNITVENLLASIDLLDIRNIDNFSDNNECNKVVVKNDKGEIVDILDPSVMKNSVYLEADIHQEEVPNETSLTDETACKHNSPLVNSPFPTCSKFDVSSENDNAHSFNRNKLKQSISELNKHDSNALCDRSITKLPIVIHDLDDLRALAREDSEDSQSLYSSTNGSSQDISCWESITEHDDDFLWSRSEEIETCALPSDKDDILDFMNIQKPHFNVQAIQTSVSDNSDENSISKFNVGSVKDKVSKRITEPTVLSFNLPVVDDSVNYEKSPEPVFVNTFAAKYSLNKVNNINSNENSENMPRTSSLKKNKIENLWIECEPDDTVNDSSLREATVNNAHSLEKYEDSENISRYSTFNKNEVKNLWIECDPNSITNDTSMSEATTSINNTHTIEKNEDSGNISKILTFNKNEIENLWIECGSDDTTNTTSLSITKPINIHSIKKNENSGNISRILTFNENEVENLCIECVPDDTANDITSSKITKPVNNIHSIEKIEDSGNKSALSTFNKNEIENLWTECDPDNNINCASILVAAKPNAVFDCIVINDENVDNEDNDIFIIEPKPPRHHDQNFNLKKNLVSDIVSSINTNVIDTETENITDWSIIENDILKENCISESEIKVDITPTIPKPQREIFEKKSVPTESSFSSPKSADKKSVFNLSVDAVPFEWSFPDYIHTEANENLNLNENSLRPKMAVGTQTESSDFAFMYKVSVGQNSLDSCKYTTLIARPCTDYQSKDSKESTGKVEAKICQQIVMFDKSASTNDLNDDIEISEKLRHLHDCYPDISLEDLTHLLEICNNDETWIGNLLLEWGYKYNVQTEDAYSDVMEVKEASNEKRGYFGSLFNKKCQNVLMEDEKNKNSEDYSQPSTSVEPNSLNMDSEHSTPPNTANFPKLHLVLDPAFAYQLEELFGPVTTSGSNENRCVEIDLEFAQLLHSKWKDTLNCTNSGLLNNEFKAHKRICSQDQRENSSPLKKDVKEPHSLSEIMDMEYALQIHKQERLMKDTDFATKLKRLELYNMFPGADPIALDEIFESHNYSLKDCVFALGEDIGQQGTLQQQQKQNIEKMDRCVIEWSKSRDFQEFENGDFSEWVYKEDNIGSVEEATLPVVSSTISPEAASLRALATEHYQHRQELIAKAQRAYCRGMKDVASFYAQKGSEHGLLFKDANKKASALIAQQRNMSSTPNVLDLHGLYVQEAIPTLERFLREKKLDLKRRQQTFPMTISVVTGQGLHSMRGPKLRPSVVEYLRQTGYNFYEINRGMVEVTVVPE